MVIHGYLVFVIHVGFKWIKVAEYLNKLRKKSMYKKKVWVLADFEEPKNFSKLNISVHSKGS